MDGARMERQKHMAAADTPDRNPRDLTGGTDQRALHASGAVNSGKPGERVPPGQKPLRSLQEADKAPGVGGGPSPVGENDLA